MCIQSFCTGEEQNIVTLIYDKTKWAVLCGDSVSDVGSSVLYIISRQAKDVEASITIQGSKAEWKFKHKYTKNDNRWTLRIDPMTTISSNITVTITEEAPSTKNEIEDKNKPFPINIRALKVDDMIIGVAPELLALQSSYFEKLFYQDFIEARQNIIPLNSPIFSYKQLNFVCDILHSRRIPALTTAKACSLLELGDYLDSPVHRNNAVSFLKRKESIPFTNLKRVLVVADNFNEPEILEKVLTSFQKKEDLEKVLDLIRENISPGTVEKIKRRALDLKPIDSSHIELQQLPQDKVYFRFTQGLVVVQLETEKEQLVHLQHLFRNKSEFGPLEYCGLRCDEHMMKPIKTCNEFKCPIAAKSVENVKYYLYLRHRCEYIYLTPLYDATNVGYVIQGDDLLDNNTLTAVEDFGLYSDEAEIEDEDGWS